MKFTRFTHALAGAAIFAVASASSLSSSTALGASITINDQGTCSWSWDASTRTLTCSPVGNPPPRPESFACTFAPAGPVTAGTSLPLMVSCSNGTIATVAWSASGPGNAAFANGISGWGGNSVVLPAAGTWTITAVATATSGGPTVTAQAAVQVNAAAVPVVAGSGGNICAAYGFAKTIRSTWDWTSNSGHSLDTYITSDTDGGVGLGPNGILVVDFVPTGPNDNVPNIALISATGYPAPNMTNVLTVAISTSPCTLYAENPGSASDTSPTVTYGVGAVNRFWTGQTQDVALTPGVRYYINVAGRDRVTADSPYGTATCVPGRLYYPYCDIRLEFQKPARH